MSTEIEVETPPEGLNELEQAVYHHSRKRTRSLRDIAKGLTRTHRFDITEATVLTGDVFPSRARPMTMTTEIEITGVAATGLLFEFGSSTTGIKLAVDLGSLFFAAGDVAVGDGGIDGSVVIPALDVVGARLQVAVAISPGLGQARIWVDGLLVARIQNTPAVKLTNDNWSDTGSGSIAAIQNGTSNSRVAITAAPVDFEMVERLSVYMGQLPKAFQAAS